MNWSFLVIAFCLAVIMGATAAATLARMRPEWSARRRMMVSALALPAVTMLAAAGGVVAVLLSGPGEGENMRDLAMATIAALGAMFALLAFVGGIIGAGLMHQRLRR